MKIAKALTYLCIAALLIQTILLFYYNWASFSEKYDVAYWKDRYDHSQWQLRLSQRPIGDDALYAHAGYRLVHGADPSLVITDKPPAALYLVGFSIAWFGNVAWMAFLAGIGSLVCLYFLSVRLLKNKLTALVVTTLFYLDPLFFSQLWKSWLDIYQLLFLLLNLVAFVYLVESEKRKYLLAFVSGAAVCLFFETKMQTLFPILVFLESVYLLYKKLWKELAVYYVGFGVALLATYARYFMLGHSVLDLIKFHKYIATIYLISRLPIHPWAVYQSLLSGNVPNVNSGDLEPVIEWTYVWPLLSVIGVAGAGYMLLKKKESWLWRGLGIALIASILMYMRIPFYSRYILLILPFLYLFTAWVLQQNRWVSGQAVISVVVIISMLLYIPTFLTAKPDAVIAGYYYNFEHQFFNDVYQENVAEASTLKITRDEFNMAAKRALYDAQIRKISIKELSRQIGRNEGNLKIEVTYHTQNLGPLVETKTVQLRNVHNRWGVAWNWDLLLDNYSLGDKVRTAIVLGKRGTITKGGSIVAQDKQGYLISVLPEQIEPQKEEELLALLERQTGFTKVVIHDYYVQNRVAGAPVPLVTTWQDLKAEDKKNLLSFAGVLVSEYPVRNYANSDYTHITNTAYTECCTRIYSSYNYHGINGTEKEYDAQLSGYSGGTLTIVDPQGSIKKTLITKEAQNGHDVSL